MPTGGKTGTTQKYRDAWFIGFTPDLPAEIWRDFLSRAASLLAKDKRSAPTAQVAAASTNDTVPAGPGVDLV